MTTLLLGTPIFCLIYGKSLFYVCIFIFNTSFFFHVSCFLKTWAIMTLYNLLSFVTLCNACPLNISPSICSAIYLQMLFMQTLTKQKWTPIYLIVITLQNSYTCIDMEWNAKTYNFIGNKICANIGWYKFIFLVTNFDICRFMFYK